MTSSAAAQNPTSSPNPPTEAPLQIGVTMQYVKDLSFESPSAPHIFAPSDKAPTLDMGVNVNTRVLADNTYEVLLNLKLEAKLESKTGFIAELSYGGVFTVPALNEDQLRFILLVEAPRLLFPFARNILANAVRDGGFPQVLVTPIDFATLYQQNQQAINNPPAGSA